MQESKRGHNKKYLADFPDWPLEFMTVCILMTVGIFIGLVIPDIIIASSERVSESGSVAQPTLFMWSLVLVIMSFGAGWLLIDRLGDWLIAQVERPG